jgi:type II secretory pathway pseudopilin PulG
VTIQPNAGNGGSKLSAFTIVEVMVAAGVLALALGSIFALNSQVINNLRRGTVSSFASQLIQERMEQFRRAAWTELTSSYPPDNVDPADAGYDSDIDTTNGETAYVDDTYPTEFPYDLAEVEALTPGLQDLMAVPASSAAQLPNVLERVTVQTYNASNSPIDIFNSDGTTATVQPFQCGGTPIIVERQNGVATTISHNPVAVLSTTVRLTLSVSWKGTDNVTRTKETVTLFTVEGDK